MDIDIRFDDNIIKSVKSIDNLSESLRIQIRDRLMSKKAKIAHSRSSMSVLEQKINDFENRLDMLCEILVDRKDGEVWTSMDEIMHFFGCDETNLRGAVILRIKSKLRNQGFGLAKKGRAYLVRGA